MALVRRCVTALALIVTTLAITPVSHADATSPRPRINPRSGLAIGFMPTHRQVARMSARRSTAPVKPPAPNLHYWGGPVVTSAQVASVLWGASGTYIPEVAGAPGATDINTATQAMLSSEWAQGLSEFSPSPTMRIGLGTATGRTSIVPSAVASVTTIDDQTIQDELISQINSRHLGAPTANTIYALYFPSGTLICDAAQQQPGQPMPCSNNAFCAYHGATTATVNNIHALYIVQPFANDGWMDGCANTRKPASGWGSSQRAAATETVLSHEVSETITDPMVSLAPTDAPPLGWYSDVTSSVDPTAKANASGEVGDLCQSRGGYWTWPIDSVAYTDAAGVHFSVQQYWSNRYKACAPKVPSAPRGFRVSALAGGRLLLTWSPPADDGLAPVQGYGVYEVTPKHPPLLVGAGPATSLMSPALPIGHALTFFVRARNNVGGGYYGPKSANVTTTSATTPAAVPSIRKVRGGTSPIIGWSAAPANYSAITAYRVTGPGGTRTVPSTARSFQWRNLRHGRYLITVRALNRLGAGAVRTFYLVN